MCCCRIPPAVAGLTAFQRLFKFAAFRAFGRDFQLEFTKQQSFGAVLGGQPCGHDAVAIWDGQLINPLIRCVQAQLQVLLTSFNVLEVLCEGASEVAGQPLSDVLAIVVTPEPGLEQVGYVTASAIRCVQVKTRLGRFVFCGPGASYAGSCPGGGGWEWISYS